MERVNDIDQYDCCFCDAHSINKVAFEVQHFIRVLLNRFHLHCQNQKGMESLFFGLFSS